MWGFPERPELPLGPALGCDARVLQACLGASQSHEVDLTLEQGGPEHLRLNSCPAFSPGQAQKASSLPALWELLFNLTLCHLLLVTYRKSLPSHPPNCALDLQREEFGTKETFFLFPLQSQILRLLSHCGLKKNFKLRAEQWLLGQQKALTEWLGSCRLNEESGINSNKSTLVLPSRNVL